MCGLNYNVKVINPIWEKLLKTLIAYYLYILIYNLLLVRFGSKRVVSVTMESFI